MFIPVGDTPNPSRFALVTWGLMAANIAVFIFITVPLMTTAADTGSPLYAQFIETMRERGVPFEHLINRITAYDLFLFQYGFRPAQASLLTLLSSLFLHGSWLHLAGNMLYLWIFGNNVENRLGAVGYLLIYFASGAIATLFFSFFVPDSKVPMIGASGAISGVLGCYFLWFPRNRVKVFIFLFPFFIGFILIPAPVVLIVYLLVDNLLPFILMPDGAGGIAHGAHIGGFLAGMVAALALWYKAPRGGMG